MIIGAVETPIAGLTFDELEHRYFLDSVPVPNVTNILADAGMVDWTYCSEWARERGSLVHRAIHIELTTGRLDWSSFDEAFHPFVSAALEWLKTAGAVTLASERRVVSRLYGYAGTLDWLGVLPSIDDDEAIIDFKTGPLVPAYGPQTAAYGAALNEEPAGVTFRKRYALVLRSDGSAKLERFTDRHDIDVFRAALRVTNWKREKGLLHP